MDKSGNNDEELGLLLTATLLLLSNGVVLANGVEEDKLTDVEEAVFGRLDDIDDMLLAPVLDAIGVARGLIELETSILIAVDDMVLEAVLDEAAEVLLPEMSKARLYPVLNDWPL